MEKKLIDLRLLSAYDTLIKPFISSQIADSIIVKTTQEWNSMTEFIPSKGVICVYLDEPEDETGICYPRIKIGDGNAYIIDIPYIDDRISQQLQSHVDDTSIHVSNEDRLRWDSAITTNMDDSKGTLQFKSV